MDLSRPIFDYLSGLPGRLQLADPAASRYSTGYRASDDRTGATGSQPVSSATDRHRQPGPNGDGYPDRPSYGYRNSGHPHGQPDINR